MEEEELTVQLGGTYSCKRKNGTYRDGEVVKLRVNKRSGKEEYFVHYVGLTRRQAEWVDKTRLVLCKPVKKEEDVEIGAEQKISEDEKTTQNPRPEEDEPEAEDEPETKKVKVGASGMVCKDKEHSCLLCREFCEDPVEVECGHRFCRNCINKALASQDSFLCPDCEKVITEKELATKLPLAAISKTVVDATATLVQPLEKVKAQPLEICPEHDEKLKLFCKDDNTLGCIICRNCLKHSGHKFLPAVDAVEIYRAELSTLVSPLEEALEEASELSKQQSEIIEELRDTMMECRQHIVSEFGNLYNFLKERREKLLEQLKEQSQCLLEEMKTNTKMEEKRDSLKETITVAKQKVVETDPVSFLDGVKDVVKKCQKQSKAFKSFSNSVTEEQLFQATFNAPIQYFTWKQMKSVVPVPANELVAPNTDQVPESSADLTLKDSVPEKELVAPNTDPVPESSADLTLKDSGSKVIWMVGDVFMDAVRHRAERGPLGLNLGLDKQTCILHWLYHSCYTGILFRKLRTAKMYLQAPDIIFLNSSPDLRAKTNASFSNFMISLNRVAQIVPNAVLIVSAFFPLPGKREPTLNWNRTKFNNLLAAHVKRPSFHLFRHTQLEEMLLARISNEDNGPLTVVESDLFLTAVRDVLQKALCKDLKPVSEKCCTLSSAEPVTGSKQIWIVGDGFLNAIKSQAEVSSLGLNLGFPKEICNIQWWMNCNTWLPLIAKLKMSTAPVGRPDVLLFHLGSRDLYEAQVQTVISHAQNSFDGFLHLLPNVKMILSTLLPKPECQEMRLELRRKGFNYFLSFRANKPPYHLLRHEELEKKLKLRYTTGDFNPLTEAEAEDFLQSIKDVLQQTVLKECKPGVAECELLPPGEVPSDKVQNEVTVKGPDQPSTSKEVDSPGTRKDQPAIVRVEAPVASANPPGPKEIWITGNSYILRVSQYAEGRFSDTNLGLDEQQWVVRWMKTVRQYSLLKDISDQNRLLGTPSIVYLHVGSNDLGLVPDITLVHDFKYAISELAKRYPETRFIFSSILPRPEWMSNVIELSRQMFNTTICAYAKTCGFTVANSSDLEQMLLDRFSQKRSVAFLGFKENEIFHSIIQHSILETILKISRPVTENTKPQKEVLPEGNTQIVAIPGTDPAASTKEDKEAAEENTSECLQPATEVETPEGWLDPPVDASLSSDLETKQIWIVGSSYICRAAEQAIGSSYGFNLGFKPRNWTVNWLGQVAMQWKSLLSELNDALSALGVPDIVFIHLGDNDLGSIPYDTLTKTTEDGLSQITMQFPTTEFIFSTMLPKAEWLTYSLEQVRQDFNSALIRYAEELGFHVALYEGIEESAIGRFKNGGSNVLSYAEYHLFVKSIKDALEIVVRKLEKAQTV